MTSTQGIEIGNWLFDKNGIPKQVTEIYDDSVTLGGELNHISTVNPIPLTAEILEKNGFVEYMENHFRWDYDEGIFINADFAVEEPFASINNRCYFATPVCWYVHQLQNAMRMCGIEMKFIV